MKDHPDIKEQIHDLVALYAVDALEPADRAVFAAHLATCRRCQSQVVDYAEVGAHLAEAVAHEPPPALREAVLGAIHGVPVLPAASEAAGAYDGGEGLGLGIQGTDPTTDSIPACKPHPDDIGHPGAVVVSLDVHRRRRRRLLALATAAVLLPGVALGGWGLGVQSEQRQQEQFLAQEQDRENRLLSAPDVTTHRIQVDGRTATLLVSRQQDEALFIAPDLPDPGQGREYQLWLLQDDVPVPDVHFTGGEIRTWLDGNVAQAGAVAMTVEPAGGSSTPTLPVLTATEI